MYPENYQEIEANVTGAKGSYPDLAPEALLTSIEDLQTIVAHLKDERSWVELGSGYGLGTLLFARTYPDKLAFGLEFEASRYEESLRLKNQWGLRNAYFQHANLSDCLIPEADAYFLYFPTGPVLDRILNVLGNREGNFTLVAIESHGDLLPRLQFESWLQLKTELPLTSQRHYPQAMVFQKQAMKQPHLLDFSFQDKLFLVQDKDGSEWLGESLGVEWLDQESLNLKTPARTIRMEQVIKVLGWDEISPKVRNLLKKRRAGEDLRKIFVGSQIVIERADGSLVVSEN